MQFQLSDIGRRISSGSGIEQLMDDLGHALASGGSDMRMLGGGNPAKVPEVAELWRTTMQRLLTDAGLRRQHSHAGRERAIKLFRLEVHTRKCLDVYAEAISQFISAA